MSRGQPSLVRCQLSVGRGNGARGDKRRGTHAGRRGTTLVEVLMSLLVMGIGLTTLATLFPISILRTLKAHQLTNAGILKFNAEAIIETYPHIIHDPDNDANYYLPVGHPRFAPPNGTGTQLTEHYDSVYIVDPLGWHSHAEFANGLQDTFGNDGQNPPAADTRGRQRFNGGGTYPDPPNVTAANSNNHGYLWTTASIAQMSVGIPFIAGGTTTDTPADRARKRKFAAARWFVLPDGWQEIVTATLTGAPIQNANNRTVGVTLNIPAASLADVIPQNARYRVTLFESPAASRRPGSLARDVTQVIGSTIRWDETPGNDENGNGVNGEQFGLPAGFEVDRARVEMQEWRFSYLLTVRKTSDGKTTVDIVVFFRRSFSEEDETIHDATFQAGWLPGPDGQPGVAGVDDDGVNGTDDNGELGWPGSDDELNRRVAVTFAAGTEPTLQRGGFALDIEGGLWYRIENIENETSTSAVLVFVEPIQRTTSAQGGVILPRNVVEVFTVPPPPRDTLGDHASGFR